MGIIALGSLLKGQFKLVKSSSLITGEGARNGWEVVPGTEGWLLELIWGLTVGDMEEADSGQVLVVMSFSLFCSWVPCI